MNILVLLIPISLGLGAFIWSIRANQL